MTYNDMHEVVEIAAEAWDGGANYREIVHEIRERMGDDVDHTWFDDPDMEDLMTKHFGENDVALIVRAFQEVS